MFLYVIANSVLIMIEQFHGSKIKNLPKIREVFFKYFDKYYLLVLALSLTLASCATRKPIQP